MRKSAFTLIELLVTIIIIGLLTTVATTSFLTAQRNARDNARRTSLTSLASALEAYKLVRGSYPGVVDPSQVSSPGYVSNTRCVVNDTYYYNPTATGTNSCPAGFEPRPNWIPGLGQYLSPTPIEKRYLGSDGGDTSLGSFSTNAATLGEPSGANNLTRTFSYKRTSAGYNAYVKIEGSACTGASASSICIVSK
jgi:prepilin-type N-terminal cleavage/methylation domain-containing protein